MGKLQKNKQMKTFRTLLLIAALTNLWLVVMACNSGSRTELSGNVNNKNDGRAILADNSLNKDNNPQSDSLSKTKVTFIELGSVKCIPCQMMQPVMESVEENFGNQVKVVFHDVWTPEGNPYAEVYKIEAIPTQVFLDENGEEYFRHVGFFPEEELFKVLFMKGVE